MEVFDYKFWQCMAYSAWFVDKMIDWQYNDMLCHKCVHVAAVSHIIYAARCINFY